MNGSDQLILYGHRYLVLARVALAWGAVCFLPAFAQSLRAGWQQAKTFRLPMELYLIALTAAAFVPENVHSDLFQGWIGLLVSRLTTVTAIFGLCVLGLIPLRKWHIAGFAACAAFFFYFTDRDTALVSRVETNAEALVAKLPPGTRVAPVVSAPGDWRVQFIAHSVERACAGHCFSYSNYEPSSGQFRVRARPGSPVVTDSADKSEAMSSGDYVVQPEDPPLISIYQCDDSDWTRLCAAPLSAGNKTKTPSHQKRRKGPKTANTPGDKLALVSVQFLLELAQERANAASSSPATKPRSPVYPVARSVARARSRRRFAPGRPHPASRELATMLGVHRTTVANAYAELEAEGLIQGHVGRGTLSRATETASKFRLPPRPF